MPARKRRKRPVRRKAEKKQKFLGEVIDPKDFGSEDPPAPSPRFKRLIAGGRGKVAKVSLKVSGELKYSVRYRRLPVRGGLERGLKGRFVNVKKLSKKQFSRLKLKPEFWARNTQTGKRFKLSVERANKRFTGFKKRKKKISQRQMFNALDASGYKVKMRGNDVVSETP